MREWVYLSATVTIAVMKRRLMFIHSLLLVTASLFFAGVASAAKVTDLYQARVPVVDQSPAERSRALRAGLGEVLVKVTGNSAVLSVPEVNQALTRAESFITEFGYVSYRQPGSSEETGLALSIHYAEASVDRLVRQQHLQIWPADRPELLVWVVVDSPSGGRQFVSADEQPELLSLLSSAMRARGAPLLVPLLDLADRAALKEENVWNFDAGSLAAAAERYSSDTWMAVRLYQSSTGQWRGARLLKTADGDTLSSVVANNQAELIQELVDEAVDRIASRYAFVPQSTTQQLTLNIDQVDNFQAYSAVTAYLESLELVRKLMVDYVDGDRLGLRLAVEGDVGLLLDTLRRDNRLAEQAAGNLTETAPGAYLFHWRTR